MSVTLNASRVVSGSTATGTTIITTGGLTIDATLVGMALHVPEIVVSNLVSVDAGSMSFTLAPPSTSFSLTNGDVSGLLLSQPWVAGVAVARRPGQYPPAVL